MNGLSSMKKFQDSLPMMLYRTLDAIMPLYRQVFRKHGVSEQQWRILRVLWEHKTCQVNLLASEALIPQASLVGVVNRMIDKGLIARTRSEEDRRVVWIDLTDKGRELESILSPLVDEIHAQITDRCASGEVTNVVQTLRSVILATSSTSKD
jgi:homoprotocatechuate degradation regulator HpaR